MGLLQRNKFKKLTDEELLVEYNQSSSKAALGELLDRYTHLVFGVSMKYLKNEADSHDAVMSLYERLLDEIQNHNIANFRGWLHMVARNHSLMIIRKNASVQRRQKEFEETESDVVQSDPTLHLFKEDDQEQSLQKLDQCIAGLKDDQKTCIELFYLQEKSYQEVAEITSLDLKAVKSHIQNGKRNLKNCMSV